MKQVKGWWFPDSDQHMSELMDAHGRYQHDHLHAALDYVEDGRIAIDGGAHVGTWSVVMAQYFEKVLAFEPAHQTFLCLQRNIADRALSDCIEPRNEALLDMQAHVAMGLEARERQRGNTGAAHMEIEQHGDVYATTVDEECLLALGFLKLDVEGTEYFALRGALRTIQRCKPVILVEDKAKCRQRYHVSSTKIERLFDRLQYKMAQKIGCDQIWIPR